MRFWLNWIYLQCSLKGRLVISWSGIDKGLVSHSCLYLMFHQDLTLPRNLPDICLQALISILPRTFVTQNCRGEEKNDKCLFFRTYLFLAEVVCWFAPLWWFGHLSQNLNQNGLFWILSWLIMIKSPTYFRLEDEKEWKSWKWFGKECLV